MNKKNPNAAWGLLTVIVSELVLAPGILAGAGYLLFQVIGKKYPTAESFQWVGILFGALLGLVIAFWRINQITQKWDQDDSES